MIPKIVITSYPVNPNGLSPSDYDALSKRFTAAVDTAARTVINARCTGGTPHKADLNHTMLEKVLTMIHDPAYTPERPTCLYYGEGRAADARKLAEAMDHPPFSTRPAVWACPRTVPPGFIIAMSGLDVVWIIRP